MLFVSTMKMTITIMIDGRIKPNCMLGFELQSLHDNERRYKTRVISVSNSNHFSPPFLPVDLSVLN